MGRAKRKNKNSRVPVPSQYRKVQVCQGGVVAIKVDLISLWSWRKGSTVFSSNVDSAEDHKLLLDVTFVNNS